MLCCRNSSNTAQNILKSKRCTLNFIPDKKAYFKEAVRLGFPGQTSEEKMKDCIFTLEEGICKQEQPEKQFPKVIAESFQCFECTWMDYLDGADCDKAGILDGYPEPYHDFNGITSRYGAHFILKIEKILMKEPFYNAIINGVSAKSFPRIPVDYGYRDSENFWYIPFKKPVAMPIQAKDASLESIIYAAKRIDPEITFSEEACSTMVKIPRVFLNAVLRGCVAWAKENGVTHITKEHMDLINDKRRTEKNK